MSLQAYLAFVAACVALALLPGPIVTLVVANGLRHGTRAALTNVLGAPAITIARRMKKSVFIYSSLSGKCFQPTRAALP